MSCGLSWRDEARRDGVSASIQVGDCFVIPFPEVFAPSCAQWLETAEAQGVGVL